MRIRYHIGLMALVFAALLSFHPVHAQFVQQGPKLVGTGAVGLSVQGNSVSLSTDGNTAIVGGFGDNGSAGAAWVWTRSGGVWTQQGNKLVGSGGVGLGQQGIAVALSGDGNTALVGGTLDNGATGAAWVWTRSGGVWTQQGNKLVGSGGVGAGRQGIAVALSGDGNTALVGGFTDNGNAGAAWVWTRSGGVWTQQGAKLVGTGAVGIATQGASVCLSADGNTAIIGGSNDNGSIGAAWVWTRSGGVWTQQGPKLVGTGAVGGSLQGSSVALSADSNTALVGGFGDNGSAGAAWVWTRSGGVWTQQGAKLVGSGAVGSAFQGASVSLSSDGNTALIGGIADNGGIGASWVWTRTGGVWTQLGTKLVGSGAVGAASQGTSVSLSPDGTTAIVGGASDNVNVGAAWIFVPSVVASADVSITKAVVGVPPFPAGANLTYIIAVTNSSPAPASNVVVTDTLPAGSTLVSATPSLGHCSGTTTVTCSLFNLSNAGHPTISLVMTTPAAPGVVVNTASVTATESDPNAANNSSTSTITTVPAASIPAASAWTLMALAGMLALLGGMKIRN
jgi:uncharacterized repeat protein (TIGR01451 family)